ncbi:MAG: PKD domain-containing protein, partial [Bacteroidota bacterium]
MKQFFILIFVLFYFVNNAQNFQKPSASEINNLPQWAQMMYSGSAGPAEVENAYINWYLNHPFEKNFHTQYYKRWQRFHAHNLDLNGNKILGTRENYFPPLKKVYSGLKIKTPTSHAGQPWQLIGPIEMVDAQGNLQGQQTNVYCIDQNESSPSILYCGTEPGDIFKSIDGGQNWSCVSFDLNLGGIGAVETNPLNANTVFAGSSVYLVRSVDGGLNWDTVINASGFYPTEILVNPSDTSIVLCASENGYYRSSDGGNTWTKLFNESCYDVKCKPGNSTVVYLLKDNPVLKICEFYRSNDSGVTFTLQSNGWYSSTDPSRVNMGGRLAVTPADTSRIYAYLIGDSKPNDYGYIGVYKSTDGGSSWNLPNGPAGGPYTSTHLNLAYGEPSWTYHQGFYNCAIMANPNNANEILVGGLNLWRSTNGGQTFTSVAGYSGGPLDMHVDMQDFRPTANGTWITNDGGIYFSNDFFTTDNQVKMKGVHGTELWGFDGGWNEDVFIGGAYHNGNVSWYQNYPSGKFLQLGGAEPASGYSNRGVNRKVVSSELAGKILPYNIGQNVSGFSVSLYPNESYYSAESSEMECLPQCYNMVYLGNANKLWRADPQSPYSFNLLYSFGTNTNSKVQQIEISRSNSNVLYVSQRPSSGTSGILHKSTDGGQTFSILSKPAGNSSRILLSLSAENENILWMAYPSGSNGNKIFKTTDGGQSWSNLTTAKLNAQEITSIVNIGATLGGVYAFTWKSVFYRNDTMSDWTEVNSNLPFVLKSNIARPFYRDGKIRIGTYGKGIWENTFEEQPTYPIAKAMVDKFTSLQYCGADTFHFEDHSMINHNGASWQWSFQGGTPSTSTLRNPKVLFTTPGNHQVILSITNAAGQTDSDTLNVSISQFSPGGQISEGFQGSFPPTNWFLDGEPNGGQWTLATNAGGLGLSSQSVLFDNYVYDSQSEEAYIYTAVDMNSASSSSLFFHRAYAEYGFPYSDTLRIDVSPDCGNTWTTLYTKGGQDL